jgi:uncharacterized protein
MAMSPDYRTYTGARTGQTAAVLDAGLRAYMLRVYNWMTSGLLLTGLVAYGIAQAGLADALFMRVQTASGIATRATGLGWIAILSPLAFVLVLSFGVNKLSTRTVQAVFWAFCVAMGASLTSIFIQYTGESIVRTFFITAATFGAMSLYGYATKSDLTKLGSFCMMGLFGIIIASLVNGLLVHSSEMQVIVSIIGVLVFVGLTAYDTQRIKADYTQFSYAQGSDIAARRSVYDALRLLLNFINLFMLLLQLTGNRSSNN